MESDQVGNDHNAAWQLPITMTLPGDMHLKPVTTLIISYRHSKVLNVVSGL